MESDELNGMRRLKANKKKKRVHVRSAGYDNSDPHMISVSRVPVANLRSAGYDNSDSPVISGVHVANLRSAGCCDNSDSPGLSGDHVANLRSAGNDNSDPHMISVSRVPVENFWSADEQDVSAVKHDSDDEQDVSAVKP